MDIVTEFAYTFNTSLLGQISAVLDNDMVYAIILLCAVLLGERRPKKLVKIFSAIALAAILSYTLKIAFAVERPCVSLGLENCPSDYSFPSLHAITAFVVMIPFLNKRSFWLYFIFALFVSFSRLVLAFHSFRDIAASLALALVVYSAVDILMLGRNEKIARRGQKLDGGSEVRRQVFHMFLALCALAVFVIYGKGMLMGATFFILIVGLLFVNSASLGKTNFLIDWFIKNFERPGVRFPGWGSACYATGVLLLATFLAEPNFIITSLLILGFGDAISTLVGRVGKTALPYNKSKSVEGTLAFFISSSLLSWFFIGPLALAVSAIAALAESISLRFDDNIMIPLVLIAFFSLL